MRCRVGELLAAVAVFLSVGVAPTLALAFPVTSIAGVPDGWSSTDVTLTLTAVPAAEAVTFVQVGESAARVYTGPFAITAEGATGIVYWSRDGHTAMEEPGAATVLIDKTPPSCALSGAPVAWDPAGIIGLHLSGSDALSGVAAVRYRLDGGPVRTVAAAEASLDAMSGGWIEYWAVDRAGNAGAIESAILRGGELPVTFPSGLPAAWSRGDVTLALHAESPAGAIASTWVAVGATTANRYGAPVTVSSEGTVAVEFRSADTVGGAEATRTVLVRIDRSAPASNASGLPSAVTSRAVSIVLSAEDAVSGVAGVFYRIGASAPMRSAGTAVVGADAGEVTFEWWAVDCAGNEEAHHTAAMRFDALAPSTTCDVAGSYTSTVTAHLQASDNAGGVGVASTWYRLDGNPAVRATSVVVGSAGSHTLEYWSVDALGNTEPHQWVAFAIAAAAPVDPSDPPTASVPPTSSIPPTATAIAVGRPHTPSSVWRRHYFSLYGDITPRIAGSTPVKIACYRLVGTHWVWQTTVKASLRSISGGSRYSVRMYLSRPGRWRFRACVIRGATRTYSGYRYMRVL